MKLEKGMKVQLKTPMQGRTFPGTVTKIHDGMAQVTNRDGFYVIRPVEEWEIIDAKGETPSEEE